jgi:3',5'-nucleoside bisphosphate phosphatase
MSAPAFDLQSHSIHSDGELAAAQVVENAAAAGVRLLALSDHDTVDGVDEALAAGALHGVRVVPATEISAVDGEYEDLHVLGYGIDHRSALLNDRLLDARGDRERRADAMAGRLRELGFEVDPAPIEARKAAGKPVGRPHLAAAVLAHPANAERLAEEDHADVSSFIPAYLIQGMPGYVARTHPTVEEAIGWIHDAAGVAVWAHPFWDVEADNALLAALERYREAGLDGVEVFYPSHTREQTLLLADRCEELGLLATGSSDYHGPTHRLFSRFRAFELHGREPNLGPIAHGTLAAPARGGDGLCVWLTGLSGSGKSTIGRLAAGELRDLGHRVEVLDGDDVRQNLCSGLGFSREDRDVNVRRIAWVADLLARNGVITFVAAVSPYRGARDEARARMGERFLEVHVRASVEECERRDVKGLYGKARAGEIEAFTGVSDPYEEPLSPDLLLDTEHETPADSAVKLIALIEERLARYDVAGADFSPAGA